MKNKSLFSKIIFAGLVLVSFSIYPIYSLTPKEKATTQKIAEYTCSMHPDVVMDKPGNCPECEMKLVEEQYVLKEDKNQTASIPNEVNVVFNKSCMACHGTGGKLIPMLKLNLSKWDKYNSDKQVNKAATICDMVTKELMPPKAFRTANPETILTATQKEMICNWSQTLTPGK